MQLEIFTPTKKALSKKTGIRAKNLVAALSSFEELSAQRPSFSKPAYLIEDIDVVIDQRASAKDHALYEALLAVAKDGGMEHETHEIRAEVLMAYLQTDSIERLLDALVRLAATTVVFEVRDVKRRKKLTGASGLVQFLVETDDPARVKAALKKQITKSSATVHFKIPPIIREAFLQPKSYAWINLYSISKFASKYTNALYQLFAVKAAHDEEHRRPLKIGVQALAEKMGWKQPKGQPFNAALFNLRALQPALLDIEDHVRDFTVVQHDPVRDERKRGRPLKELVFEVVPTPLHLLSSLDLKGKKKQRVRAFAQAEICMPDHIHPTDWLPSLEAVSRVSHLLKKPNFYSNKFIAAENSNRPRHLALWWRTTLDAVVQNPEIEVSESLTGFDVLAGLDDRRIGVDRIFSQWALDKPVLADELGVTVRHIFIAPRSSMRQLPSELVLKKSVYGMVGSMLMLADDLTSPYAAQLIASDYSLATAFENYPGVWEAVRQAAVQENIKLGGLAKAMTMMSRAHPVRMRQTAKTVCNAIFDHDWKKIEQVVKAIFANQNRLLHHPQNGRVGRPAEAPKMRSSNSMSLSTADLEAMI